MDDNKNNRREFLKTIGVLGLATATPPLIIESENENSSEEIGLEKSASTAKAKTIVTILQTTDVHCQIHPHDELFWENEKAIFRKTGGYAHMATMINELKKKNANTFVIDTGDMFQGSELSVKTSGKAFIPILNAINYNLYLPGNWEVIYGKRIMQNLLGSLKAPKVCANMYHDLGDGKKGELIFQAYHIWNVAGAKIGFLGYTDPYVPLRQSPSYSKGILYTKPEENLAYYIDVLRNQEQCSFIILLSHLGLSQQIALAEMPEAEGLDYILGGDTHERVRKPIQCKYAKVVEPGAFGSFIGKLDLTIQDGKVISDQYNLLEVNSNKIKPNVQILKLLEDNEGLFKEDINKVIGYSTIPLYRYFVVENPMDTFIVNALHWKFPEIDIVLSNGFRFCPPRTTPDHTGHIPITNGYIFDMVPVDSVVRIAKTTGNKLREWLENELNNVFAKNASSRMGGWVVKFKGMEVSFYAYKEMGNRIQSITVKGQAIELDKQYSILACERDGDPEDMLCRLKGVIEAKNTKATFHKILIDYLKANSPITPIPQNNAKILDAPSTLLTQVSGVDYKFY